jgi:hypothetical protein
LKDELEVFFLYGVNRTTIFKGLKFKQVNEKRGHYA